MNISYDNLKRIVFAYIGLPAVLFLVLYCHSLIGVCLGMLTLLGFVLSVYKKQQTDSPVHIPVKTLVAVALICIAWCYFGGQGGLYYQSGDWNMRNTLFRDIINFDWPVVYEQYDKALVYYISYWLPAALVGKGVLLITGSAAVAFTVGNLALWAWTAMGVFLVCLLFITAAKPKTARGMLFIPAFLIFFSGMDIIGIFYKMLRGQPFPDIHLEWWLDGFQFSSLTTCLFWVFNQAVIPWLVTLCLIKEKNTRNYVYLGVCTFASGPIPFMGILVYMLGNAAVLFVRSVKAKALKTYVLDFFSPSNILALFAIPPFAFYYILNTAVGTGTADTGISLGFITLRLLSAGDMVRCVIFIMLELGAYLVLVAKDSRRDPFYILTCITAVIAPLFIIGTAYDFVMRFSIPTVMMTAVFVARFLLENRNKKDKLTRILVIALCVCLIIGAITPLTEFARGYTEVLRAGRIDLVCDYGITLDTEAGSRDTNFVAFDYQNKLFFKYFVN